MNIHNVLSSKKFGEKTLLENVGNDKALRPGIVLVRPLPNRFLKRPRSLRTGLPVSG
jgi:hypothetical protein